MILLDADNSFGFVPPASPALTGQLIIQCYNKFYMGHDLGV